MLGTEIAYGAVPVVAGADQKGTTLRYPSPAPYAIPVLHTLRYPSTAHPTLSQYCTPIRYPSTAHRYAIPVLHTLCAIRYRSTAQRAPYGIGVPRAGRSVVDKVFVAYVGGTSEDDE
eukprot:3938272-Rhodomonas_salina.1